MNTLDLYLVNLGKVTPATPETEWDGINSILVAATSADNALEIAGMYEREEVGVDNLWWGDKAIGCVFTSDE